MLYLRSIGKKQFCKFHSKGPYLTNLLPPKTPKYKRDPVGGRHRNVASVCQRGCCDAGLY